MGWEERNKYWYMKNFLLMLGAVAFMTACKDDGSGNGGSINYEEGYKYLTSLNVSDAKMVYQKTATGRTRADGEENASYYKIDFNGEESKLIIKDSIGQSHDIEIDKIIKMSDKILLINPNCTDVFDLIPKSNKDENGLDIAHVMPQEGEYLSLVDVETEKIYKWPKEMIPPYDILERDLLSLTDNKGNIYFTTGYFSYNQIYKLDISNFTIQSMLPERQEFTNFDVTGDGFIMYWNDNTNDKNYKVKCPGGRIYPITDIPFMIKDELYSYKDKKIVKWETVGNNELKETAICNFEPENPELKIHSCINNYAKNTVLLQSNYSWDFYEFDGEHYQLRVLNDFNWCENCSDNFCTNKAWYIKNNTRFYKMDMTDYQYSEFQILDYEIQTLSASSESSDIAFSGIRYMDGASVVGTITETDEIVINNVAENGNKIINLIPLN